MVIDPGLDPQAIDQRIGEIGLKPVAVLCTHGHFDHVGGAAYFQNKYAAPVYLPHADIKTMKGSNFLLMALKIPIRIDMPRLTELAPGAAIPVEGGTYRYVPCPGHTPGSAVICTDDGYGFSGDSLYAQGVGLSKLPGEDHALLKASLLQLWNSLPLGMTICPGHGPTAKWEKLREQNQALRKFVGIDVKAEIAS